MTQRKYRVIHWGTGNTGARALRQILSHPMLELVGLHVHSAEKAGRDAGELCGGPKVGMKATNDLAALLKRDADCFCYMPTEWGRAPEQVFGEIAQILSSGKNVVTTTFPPLVYAKGLGPKVVELFESACVAGKSSFYATGIEPGFTADALVLTLTSVSESIRKVHVHEYLNVADYPEPKQAIAFGFGMTREAYATQRIPGMWKHYWLGTMNLLADGLKLKLDKIRESWDVALIDRALDLGWMKLPSGTIAASYFEVAGIVDGQTRLLVSHCYSLDDTAGAQ